MVDKSYYLAAASEVSHDHIDDALWAQVCTQFPSAPDDIRKAKYTELRAAELADEAHEHRSSAQKDLLNRRIKTAGVVTGITTAVLILIVWPLVSLSNIKTMERNLNAGISELESIGGGSTFNATLSPQASESEMRDWVRESSVKDRRLSAAVHVSQACWPLMSAKDNALSLFWLFGDTALYNDWCSKKSEYWPIPLTLYR